MGIYADCGISSGGKAQRIRSVHTGSLIQYGLAIGLKLVIGIVLKLESAL